MTRSLIPGGMLQMSRRISEFGALRRCASTTEEPLGVWGMRGPGQSSELERRGFDCCGRLAGVPIGPMPATCDQSQSKGQLSCEVDVFEKWKPDAKENDRGIEAALNILSVGRSPISECAVRITIKWGRKLGEKQRSEAPDPLMLELLGYGEDEPESEQSR